jgi:tRNA (guanine37-N1)-methyltransferase
MRVPEVLLSGDPKKIGQWRRQEAYTRTRERRPDLLEENKK